MNTMNIGGYFTPGVVWVQSASFGWFETDNAGDLGVWEHPSGQMYRVRPGVPSAVAAPQLQLQRDFAWVVDLMLQQAPNWPGPPLPTLYPCLDVETRFDTQGTP